MDATNSAKAVEKNEVAGTTDTGMALGAVSADLAGAGVAGSSDSEAAADSNADSADGNVCSKPAI